jgi:cytochrome c oxidase subunit 2
MLGLTVAVTAGLWARQEQSGADDVRTVDVIASRFKFEPSTISVVEGERVRLLLRSADRMHGIGIKAFRVSARVQKADEVVAVEFVATRPGTFDITCSEYCGTGHSAMKARLIVLPRTK